MATATRSSESIDISERNDVDKLKSNAVGLGGVLFAALAGAAPITAMLGNVPFAVGSGNGIGAPSGFAVATIVLTIFSVGYVAMARKITAVGGFYAFISHGLGRTMGVAAGLVGALAYGTIVAALLGGMSYFAQVTFEERLGVVIPWPVFAMIALVLIAGLTFFDIDLSLKVLGVLMALEVLVLLVMDFGILFTGGNSDTGLNMEAVNVVNAFKTTGTAGAGAAGLGIFMAFWSWVGFEACPNYAEESTDPVKNVPRATYISVISLGVFYVFTSWMVVSYWGANEDVVAKAGEGLPFFYEATTGAVGSFVTKAMQWLVITGSFACAMAFHNAAMRYWYAMGREGLLPRALGKTHAVHRSPYMASLFQTAVSFVLILAYMVFGRVQGGTQQEWTYNAAYLGAYTQLALFATLWIVMLQTLVSISIPLYFRKHHTNDVHIWKTTIAPIVAAIAQAGVIVLLIVNLDSTGGTKGIVPFIPWLCFGWLGFGILLATFMRTQKPDVYAQLGRFVSTGMSGVDEPVPVPGR